MKVLKRTHSKETTLGASVLGGGGIGFESSSIMTSFQPQQKIQPAVAARVHRAVLLAAGTGSSHMRHYHPCESIQPCIAPVVNEARKSVHSVGSCFILRQAET